MRTCYLEIKSRIDICILSDKVAKHLVTKI